MSNSAIYMPIMILIILIIVGYLLKIVILFVIWDHVIKENLGSYPNVTYWLDCNYHRRQWKILGY